MTTPMIKVDGIDLFIVPSGFVFVRQTCVKFCGKRLSKEELIKCCEYFISELKLIYSPDRLKIGFNLNCFKYHELSIYLHGLISLLCSKIECSCPSCFGLFRFSHLPHEILKPEKQPLTIECALLHRYNGEAFYVCMTQEPLCSPTFEGLKKQVCEMYLKHISDFSFILK